MNICKKCIHDGICYMQRESVTKCTEFDDVNNYKHKQGYWNYAPDGEPRCSICNKKVEIDTETGFDFCPFCGAEIIH